MYPRRPGAQPCQYYLKTGKCNYFQRCKFDHPFRDKSLLTALSRRDCFDFVQSGTCPYGTSCKYNHPPRQVLSRNTEEDADLDVNNTHLDDDSRSKIISTSIGSAISQTSPNRELEPPDIRYSSPFLYNTIIRHPPSVARSEGTDSTWSSSPDDAISAMQEGIRPFEWLSSGRRENGYTPSRRGFDPLCYDAQLFGSPQSWSASSSYNR